MKVIATGQYTIRDEADIWVGTTPPENPVIDQLWIDTSVNPSVLKRWDGTKWVVVNDVSPQIKDIMAQIEAVNTVVAEHKVSLDGISSKVVNIEEKTVILDGKVEDQEIRITSAEQKITDEAIISTVSETIKEAKDEAIDHANSILDGVNPSLDYIARWALNTPCIVTDNSLPIYAISGMPNPPIGAVFNSTRFNKDTGEPYLKKDSVSSNGVAWAIISLYEMHNHTSDPSIRNSCIKIINQIASFMHSNMTLFTLSSNNVYLCDVSIKYDSASDSWIKSSYKEIYISSIWLQLKAFCYAYRLTGNSNYKVDARKSLDGLFYGHYYCNDKADKGEIPSYLRGSSYEFFVCSNYESSKRLSVSRRLHANQMGYYIKQAIDVFIKDFGDDILVTEGNHSYRPSDIERGFKEYLKAIYELGNLTAKPTGLPYGYIARVTNPDGTDSYKPANWDFIEGTYGDSWFVGDVVSYTIIGYAELGLYDIAMEYFEAYFKLRVDVSSEEWVKRFTAQDLVFYDRIDFNTGSHLEKDNSISITYTALFYDLLTALGYPNYQDLCAYTINRWQAKSKNKSIDGGFHWNVSKDLQTLETKSFGEIINSKYFRKLNPSSVDIVNQEIIKMRESVSKELSDIVNAHTDLENTINTSFKDGVISESESLAINERLSQIEKENADIEKEYSSIYNNSSLDESSAKSNLKARKEAFDTAYSNLASLIRSAISDKKIVDSERNSINSATTTYKVSFANYKEALSTAIDKISSNKVDNLEIRTNEKFAQIKITTDGITQTVGVIKQDMDKEFGDVSVSLDDIKNLTNPTLKDNVDSSAKKESLKKSRDIFVKEHNDILSQASFLENAKELNASSEKTDLTLKKQELDASFTELIKAIDLEINSINTFLDTRDTLTTSKNSYTFLPTEIISIEFTVGRPTYGYLYGLGNNQISNTTAIGNTLNFPKYATKGTYNNCYVGTYLNGSTWTESNRFTITIGESTAPEEILPTSVSVNYTSNTLTINQAMILEATVLPSNAVNKDVTFTSSNSSIVTIDPNGWTVGKSAGTATLTARTHNNLTATCSITVVDNNPPSEILPTNISLNKTSVAKIVGETETLIATITPSNATNKTVTWVSSNTSVATVNNGLVNCLKAGSTTITARTHNGRTSTCNVTVSDIEQNVDAKSISLNKTTLNVNIGKEETLTASILPTNTSNKAITWISTVPSVATVNNGRVRAVSNGTTTIIAKTHNNLEATCSVTVAKEAVPVASVTLNKTSITKFVDETEVLVATIKPDDADNKTLTWTSSNNDIVTVLNGLVTAKSNGNAIITCTSSNNKKATCNVSVKTNESGINGSLEKYKVKSNSLRESMQNATDKVSQTKVDVVGNELSEFKQTTDSFKFQITSTNRENLIQNSAPDQNLAYWDCTVDGSSAGRISPQGGGENFENEYFSSGVWLEFEKASNTANNWVVLQNESIRNFKFNIGKKYTLVAPVYRNNDLFCVNVTISHQNASNHIMGTGYTEYRQGYDWVIATFTPSVEGVEPDIRFIVNTNTSERVAGRLYVPWVNLYEGDLVIKQHIGRSNETIKGITTIDQKGVTVDMLDGDSSQGYTRVASDGVEVYNGKGRRKAWFGQNDTAYVDVLEADNIKCGKIVKWAVGFPQALYVAPTSTGDGSGRDAENKANSVNHALNWFTNTYGTNLWEKDLYIEIGNGTYYEDMYIWGFSGKGRIIFSFYGAATVYGKHHIYDNDVNIYFTGRADSSVWSNWGCQFWYKGDEGHPCITVRKTDVLIQGCRIGKEGFATGANDWNGYTGTGVFATYDSSVILYNNDIIGFKHAVIANENSRVSSFNIRGHNTYISKTSWGSRTVFEGYVPFHATNHERDTAGENVEINVSGHDSAWYGKAGGSPSLPSFVWSENTFTASNLRSIPEGSGSGTSTRTGMWGQGNWGSGKAHRGHCDFGGSPSSWCYGGRNFTAWITLTRINSGGYNGEIPRPHIKRPNGQFWDCGVSFSHGQTKTIQLPPDITSAIVNGSMQSLEMYCGKNQQMYSFYNYTSLKIKCEKGT